MIKNRIKKKKKKKSDASGWAGGVLDVKLWRFSSGGYDPHHHEFHVIMECMIQITTFVLCNNRIYDPHLQKREYGYIYDPPHYRLYVLILHIAGS